MITRGDRHALALLILAACSGAGDFAGARVPEANLLSYSSGTIVRSYTKGIDRVELIADGATNADGDGPGLEGGTKGPIQIIYELPGVATLSSLSVALESAADVTIALSTTSAADGFHDAGSAHAAGAQNIAGAAGVKARWIRVTSTLAGDTLPIKKMTAAGAVAARPANAPAITGDFWAFADKLNDAGRVLAKPAAETPERLEVTQIGDGVNGLQCSENMFTMAFPGKLEGRTWTYVATYEAAESGGRLIVNDEGTLLVGADDLAEFAHTGRHGIVAMRAFARAAGGPLPGYCTATKHGTGSSDVLVLNSPEWDPSYPSTSAGDLAQFKNISMTVAGAPLLTSALLGGMDMVVLNGLCQPQFLFNAQQTTALMQWVQAGHKLLITDSDMCSDPDHPTHYDFLPYRFQSDNPGAMGAKGNRVTIVENNTLGTTDTNDKEHFVDMDAYFKDGADLGDANTVITQDDHWCGHLFGTNIDSVAGFMQMYAIYGKGLIIYDGLDHDDATVAQYQTLRRLEYAEPIPPDLPCTRRADAGFLIVPDENRSFLPGKVQTITVPLQVFNNLGWKGHVALAAVGDFHAVVSPAAIDMPPAILPISVSIDVPATAKAGHYVVIVKGSGAGNQTAQATITLSTAETASALKIALESSCKVPVYGVNFDFNKTTIRPDADPVLQQILALFKGDPQLAAEIGGHTDNVGTPAYNLTLSGGRADAVKAWLIAHGVAASRLTTRGYGDTAPLVPNDSDANRAKNRRVELKKPNCDK